MLAIVCSQLHSRLFKQLCACREGGVEGEGPGGRNSKPAPI